MGGIYYSLLLLIIPLLIIIFLKLKNADKSKLKYGDYEGRIKKYTLRIQFDVKDEMAFYERGVAYYKAGNHKAALEDLKMAATLGCSKAYDVIEKYNLEKPSNNQIFVKDRQITYKVNNSKLSEYSGAISDYDKAINSDPNNSVAYLMRAGIKDLYNDHTGALNDLNNALKFNNKYSEAYYKRGTIKIKLNDFDGAKRDLETSLSLGFMRAKQLLGRIDFMSEERSQNQFC
ncbi:MAG: hypothetical protein OQJ81_07830 [Melioribacteraceae bacterium]|nr:hypothetical protein [Melioribacteraceae bacterium]